MQPSNSHMRRWKKYGLFFAIAGFIVLVNLIFFFWSPELVVSKIGIKNTYLLAFLASAIGGLSTLTGAALFTTIVTFVAGGSHPFWLALSAGMGIFLSDSVFYFLIFHGRKSIPLRWENRLERIQLWMAQHPPKTVLTAAYLYMSFTPLPNDLLMIGLVIGGFSYKRIVWVVLAGSLTVAFVTAYLGQLIFN